MPGYGWAIWYFGLTRLPAQPVLQPYKQVRLLRALIPGDSFLQAVGAATGLVQGEVQEVRAWRVSLCEVLPSPCGLDAGSPFQERFGCAEGLPCWPRI